MARLAPTTKTTLAGNRVISNDESGKALWASDDCALRQMTPNEKKCMLVRKVYACYPVTAEDDTILISDLRSYTG